MSTATSRPIDQHFLIRHYSPPVYGDRPEPWQEEYLCACGEELWSAEEGQGSTPGTPEDALQEHLGRIDHDDEEEREQT
ncbi:MAG: hypothetical protein Q4C81_04180 [Kocuria sp.]|nr:hypothetical protein [Kocuria sp.]